MHYKVPRPLGDDGGPPGAPARQHPASAQRGPAPERPEATAGGKLYFSSFFMFSFSEHMYPSLPLRDFYHTTQRQTGPAGLLTKTYYFPCDFGIVS